MLWSAFGATMLATIMIGLIVAQIRTRAMHDTRALLALDALTAADRALQRDVMLVRSGLLLNYDPVVVRQRTVSAAFGRLSRRLRCDRLAPAALASLADAEAAEQHLVETFKSRQALIRNSLAYMPVLVGEADETASLDPSLAARGQAIGTAVLAIVSTRRAETAAALETALAALRATPVLPPERPVRDALLRHGELLERIVPEVDASLGRLAGSPMRPAMVVIRRDITHRGARLDARSLWFTSALYLVSLLLVLFTVRMIANQRRSRLALEERIAVDQSTAAVSTLFLGAEPGGINDVLDLVVATIGRATHCDRVTLQRDADGALHSWNRTGPGHGEKTLDLAVLSTTLLRQVKDTHATFRHLTVSDGFYAISSLADAPWDAARQLAAAGTRAWVGCVLGHGGKHPGLLTFEQASRRTSWARSGVAVLKPLVQMIAQALDRERLIEEREALHARLLHSQRLEAAGSLASGLAHNFNNIVGAMLGHAEMAVENIAREHSPLVHVQEIRVAAQRASELVENMLNLGRRHLPKAGVDVGALASETMSLLRASLPADVRLLVEIGGDGGCTVLGRAGEIQQVMLNLVRNAAQACGDQGTVRFTMSRIRTEATRRFRLGTLPPGDYVRLEIADDGGGMNAATLDRIFEPFFTTRPAGTGLGLATVADIVRDHSGAMDVQSVSGEGSVFDVWFPIGDTDDPAVRLGRGNGEIILVLASGDRSRLLALEDTLAALGYEPAGFDDAAAALDNRVEPDAVLIDAGGLEARDEFKLALLFRASRPGLPVFLLANEAPPGHEFSIVTKGITVIDRTLGVGALARALQVVTKIEERPTAPS